ncbi:helix-turn-helix domain-containing protein [Kiritimatiellota bacterium B12222]|nr:helix-turn-helix domain-containing protein [Kiritimatiellota bacterium B12222]
MTFKPVKSVAKAIQILELLIKHSSENKVLTLSDVHASTGILPATAHNLLKTLEHCGYAQRRAHGQYSEGERCYTLLRTGGIIRKLKETSTPIIEQTVNDLNESLLLVSIVNGKRVELIRKLATDDTTKAPNWKADEHIYQMRTTRVILAWFSLEQLHFFIERAGLPSTKDWPECENSLKGLTRELELIRHKGGCNDNNTHPSSFVAIAVPILSSTNEIIGSLGCYAPRSRTDMARATGIFQLMQDCANRIQTQLFS